MIGLSLSARLLLNAKWLSRSERGWLAAAAVALRLGRQAASVARSLAHEKSSALC